MSANSRSVLREYFGNLCGLVSCIYRGAQTTAFPMLLLALLIALMASAAWPQGFGGIDLLDTSTQAGPGPGSVVTKQTSFGTFVYSASFVAGQPGEIVTHRISLNNTLVPLGRTPAGREPRQVALSLLALYAVNSIDNTISVLPIKGGLPQSPAFAVPSGGLGAWDIATPEFPGGRRIEDDITRIGDTFAAVNRDSDNVCLFRYDGSGGPPILQDCAPTGDGPHVVKYVAELGTGFLAVLNEIDQSISLYKTDGNTLEPKSTIQLSARPRDFEYVPRNRGVCTEGINCDFNHCVVKDQPAGSEDTIECFDLDSNGQPINITNTLAGHFATDIAVVDSAPGIIIAATVNANGPGGADDRDEYRAFLLGPGGFLNPIGSIQTPTLPPNFKQIAIACHNFETQNRRLPAVVGTEFQSDAIMRLFALKVGDEVCTDF